MQLLSNFIEVQKTNDFNAHITMAKKWASLESLNLKAFNLPDVVFDVLSFSIFTVNVNRSPRYEEICTVKWRRGENNGPTS